jgi:polyhydroxybutyrate depolymerase
MAQPSEPTPSCSSPSASPAPAECAKHPGALRNESVRTVEVGGRLRSFIYYAPQALDPEVPAPLLILAHARTVGAAELIAISQLESLADREGFLLLAPDGERPNPWNIGRDNCPSATGPIASAAGDDQAFLDAMLGFVSADRALDGEHVYMAGFGAGGYWASETACRRPALRAFAAHSAGSHPLTNCDSPRTPAILFHGLRDDVVPPDCGRETRARWAQRNGCSENVEPRPVLGGVCEYSTGCPEGGQVVLCLFDELGLAWAGGIGQREAPPDDFASASELSWEFFKTYAW